MLGRCSFLLKAFAILVLCQSFGTADILNNRNDIYSERHASRNGVREPNYVTTRILRIREPERKNSYRRSTLEFLKTQERRLDILPRQESLKLDTRSNRRDMRTERGDRNENNQYRGTLRYNAIRSQRDTRHVYDQVSNRRILRINEKRSTDSARRNDNLARYFRAEERKELTRREENLRRNVRAAERSSRLMLERVGIDRTTNVPKQDDIRERRQTVFSQKRRIVTQEQRRNREVSNFDKRRTQNMLLNPVGDSIQKRVFREYRKDMSRINLSQPEGQQFNYMKTPEGKSVMNFLIYKIFTSAVQGLLVVSMFKSSSNKM